VNLPKDRDHGQPEQKNGNPFSKGFSLVLALFLGSVSASLCRYGVNKSREIGGLAVGLSSLAGSFFSPLVGSC
jgi:hypothetical protein